PVRPRATLHLADDEGAEGNEDERALPGTGQGAHDLLVLSTRVAGQEDPQPCVRLVDVLEARRRVTALAGEDEGIGAEAPIPEERDETPYEPVLDAVGGVRANAGLSLAVDGAVGDVDPVEAIVDGHKWPPLHEQVREDVRAHARSVVVFP